MKSRILVALMAASGLICAASAQAANEGPWLVRARAVDLNFSNNQADSLESNVGAKVEAENRWIPEFDISYFFTKNIAAELILTYPQAIDIKIGGAKQGTIKALPPTLLVQYHFTDLGAIQPYVGAGLNYTAFYQTNNILGGAASIEKSSTGLAGQVGFDYVLDQHWSLNVDYKYVQMSTDVKVGVNKVGKLNLNPSLVAIGVGYRF